MWFDFPSLVIVGAINEFIRRRDKSDLMKAPISRHSKGKIGFLQITYTTWTPPYILWLTILRYTSHNGPHSRCLALKSAHFLCRNYWQYQYHLVAKRKSITS